MKFWINLLGYQAVWFITVICAGHDKTWPSVVAASVFVVSQLAIAERVSVELRLLVLAVLCGMLIDGVLAWSTWARYAAASPALPAHGAPLWILAIWACFATTLNRSLAYLRDRWWLAVGLGAIGAPLAYLGAQRGWHAVVFPSPAWRGITWIAASWAVVLPGLALLARRWSTQGSATTTVTTS